MIAFGDVAVVVADAKAAAKWWTEKLGFELRDDMDHWITVAPKGATTVIHLCANGTREEGNTGIGFEVANIEATQAQWMAKGVKFTQPAEKKPWGSVAHFVDPDGNEYWLSENEDLAKPARKAARKAPAKVAKKSAKKGQRRQRENR